MKTALVILLTFVFLMLSGCGENPMSFDDTPTTNLVSAHDALKAIDDANRDAQNRVLAQAINYQHRIVCCSDQTAFGPHRHTNVNN